MQRQSNTFRGAELSPPHTSLPMPPYSPEMKIDEATVLPLFRRHSGDGKRGVSRYRCSPERRAHFIPVVVILCLFILWWFSHPVYLEMKNGRMIGVSRQMIQQNTYLANLASIFTPYPSISENGGQ
ncbi:hypothetical protein ACP275_04G195700 [Erythranthe tilingii]